MKGDTHVELVLDPGKSEKAQRVLVEVIPRCREMMRRKGVDWSTQELSKTLLGHRVKKTGWLFFDGKHTDASENTNPGRTRSWRATAGELYPVTSITIVHGP